MLVPRDQPAPTVSQLRRFARERLPEYMVPSSLCFLTVCRFSAAASSIGAHFPVPIS